MGPLLRVQAYPGATPTPNIVLYALQHAYRVHGQRKVASEYPLIAACDAIKTYQETGQQAVAASFPSEERRRDFAKLKQSGCLVHGVGGFIGTCLAMTAAELVHGFMRPACVHPLPPSGMQESVQQALAWEQDVQLEAAFRSSTTGQRSRRSVNGLPGETVLGCWWGGVLARRLLPWWESDMNGWRCCFS